MSQLMSDTLTTMFISLMVDRPDLWTISLLETCSGGY